MIQQSLILHSKFISYYSKENDHWNNISMAPKYTDNYLKQFNNILFNYVNKKT